MPRGRWGWLSGHPDSLPAAGGDRKIIRGAASTVEAVTSHTDRVNTFRGAAPAGPSSADAQSVGRGNGEADGLARFQALATTNSGHAATLGRLDGSVTREEALAHAASIVETVEVPVSADLENDFAEDPDSVFVTVRSAVAIGLAGCSIEDSTGDPDAPLYDIEVASERVAAAARAAHVGSGLVLTARAENFARGNPDLADTIDRLQAYQEAGADVVYAPGLTNLDDIRRVHGARRPGREQADVALRAR